MFFHDAYRQSTINNVTFNAAGGASVQSAAFGAQTKYIRICVQGAVTATSGLRVAVGDNPTASATTALLPVNWIEYVKVTPGQKIASLGNDTVTGTLSVVELTD
jgi:hypothetical protein